MSTVYEQTKRVQGEVQSLKRFLSERYGITRRQLTLLMAVSDVPKAKLGTYTSALELSPGATTALCDVLERDGYLTRERSVLDRRAIGLVLTEKGEALVNHVKADEFQTA